MSKPVQAIDDQTRASEERVRRLTERSKALREALSDPALQRPTPSWPSWLTLKRLRLN
jgi:hypothetical protein